MKKILLMLITSFLCLTSLNAQVDLAPASTSAILIESSTNKVLFEKNSKEKLSPASMTKIMTLLLLMESLDDGRISLSDDVIISENAASMGGSQVYLEANSKQKVGELLKAIGIGSANDASVAIAELIGGTEENFVAMMNKKVMDLGLKDTNFKNPHGLDEANHYTTAYDMAIIASELLKHESILETTSTYEDYFKHANGSTTWLVNTNSLVKFYEGLDGLKTGFTNEAGYCLTATKKKNDMRVITVVMKSDTKEQRNKDTISLMEYAFSQYNINTLINKDNSLGKIFVDKSINKYSKYYVEKNVNVVVDANTRDIDYSYDIELDKVTAPLKKNKIVGKLNLYFDNDKITYNIIVKENVKKSNYLTLTWNYFKDIISGNIKISL